MATLHAFCSLHKIAYNRSLDPTCPQCTLSNQNAPQLDYEPIPPQPVVTQGRVIDPASGATLDAISLKPVA